MASTSRSRMYSKESVRMLPARLTTPVLKHSKPMPVRARAHAAASSPPTRWPCPSKFLEWRELQQLRPKEWRDEILSAKNRLFRFLTSPALMRCMGLSDRTLDLQAIMDEGKVLL